MYTGQLIWMKNEINNEIFGGTCGHVRGTCVARAGTCVARASTCKTQLESTPPKCDLSGTVSKKCIYLSMLVLYGHTDIVSRSSETGITMDLPVEFAQKNEKPYISNGRISMR